MSAIRITKAGNPDKLPLSNSDTIFPSTISKKQHHLYRCSMTLNESIDPEIMQRALDKTAPRFPFIAARLTTGLFWYSLTPAPNIRLEREQGRVMRHMTKREMKTACLRVMYEGAELIAEFFHALGDGCAAMVFLRTLAAEYILQRYGAVIPPEKGVLSREDAPDPVEWHDSYQDYAGGKANPRNAKAAYTLKGEPLPDGRLHKRILTLRAEAALRRAKENHVTLNEYLVAIMLMTLQRMRRESRDKQRRRLLSIAVPVNLRKLFPSETLRNFSLCASADIDPEKGEWLLPEVCARVHNQLALAITQKEMAAGITTNVRITNTWLFRAIPLPIKDGLMRFAYVIFGIKACCLSLSNLGRFELPEAMKPYVSDVSCFMDANPRSTNSCAAITYNDRLHLCFCRSIKDTRLETMFEEALLEDGAMG